jgi:hypothetical protein
VPDLARYTLQPLQTGAEYDLFRGCHANAPYGAVFRFSLPVEAPVP